MSAIERSGADSSETAFSLEWQHDDRSNPSELTIFTPDEERLVTEWITIDSDQAVPLAEWA